MDNQTHLANIEKLLQLKYNTSSKMDAKILKDFQIAYLNNEISKKNLHEKLFKSKHNPMIEIENSSNWLKHGNIKPQEEGSLCNLQDRNMFLDVTSKCQHCNEAFKTVDHLATRCDRMLSHDYTRRHNEVVKCLHLLLCIKYGIKTSKKLRTHSVQVTIYKEFAEIRVDTRIKTDIKINNNRPDIFVYDRKRMEIVLIEVGITNQDLLQIVEVEKKRKYDLLANELSLLYKCKSRIIPYVMTWDGLVTKYHKMYMTELEVTNNIEAYIQSKVLKKTLESISFEYRRDVKEDI